MIAISDETAEQAFDALRSSRHAVAKAAYEKMTRQRKVLLARLERESNEGSVKARETYALTHPHLAAFDEDLALVEAEFFTARDERDSAAALIEGWRTIQANERAAERVR